jgi:hypothetical protein
MIFIAWFVGSFFTMPCVSAFKGLTILRHIDLIGIFLILVHILSIPRQGDVSAQRSQRKDQRHTYSYVVSLLCISFSILSGL